VANYVATSRVGLGWQAGNKFEIEASYSQQRYLFTTSTSTLDHFDQVNVNAQYKFGRFTLYGGYGRGLSEFPNSHEMVSRYYARVRFPFHIFGGG
jgi:predicted porin